MAIPEWPVTLPQDILAADYQETLPKVVIRTPMGEGPAKTRRVSGLNSRFVNVGLIMTKAQVEIFDEFFMETLLGGSLHFTWTHPRTDEAIDCRITASESDVPIYGQVSGDLVKVSFQLEILP
ncbi:MAG: hypothetical protein A2169_01095 [Deltaproteobacteria bacterium RBG_13_47_9]|nr:MAG: hypothetical protein A2169_01095 [Deltaproteobacteria bacterium RBG_13_47_9]